MPELCYFAQLDNEIKNNFKTMKQITQFNQINPA